VLQLHVPDEENEPMTLKSVAWTPTEENSVRSARKLTGTQCKRYAFERKGLKIPWKDYLREIKENPLSKSGKRITLCNEEIENVKKS
jgi:hypothetical protein